MSHLLLASIARDHPARPHWLAEASEFQAQLRDNTTATLARRIDLDRLWRKAAANALKKARGASALGPLGDFAIGREPRTTCPFGLDELCDEDFDPRATADRVAATLR